MASKKQPEKLEPSMAVVFRADKIIVRGADVDGGYTVTLKCGADQQTKIAYLMAIPQNQNVSVAVAPLKKKG